MKRLFAPRAKPLLVFGLLSAALLLPHGGGFAADPNHVVQLRETKKCVGCDLNGATLADADLTGAILVRANLANAKLNGAKLNGVTLADADLTGAILTVAKLNGAKLNGAD